MKKGGVKNGDIVAIPLGKYRSGYGYAKYIDTLKEWGDKPGFPGLLRIFNYVTNVCEKDIDNINEELLMSPIGLALCLRVAPWTMFDGINSNI